MYYVDQFKMDLKTAGLTAGIFGLPWVLFARALGGIISDKVALKRFRRTQLKCFLY